MAPRCHYDALQLAPGALSADIKRSYRVLALKYHPDKNQSDPDGRIASEFREIQDAYETLSDPAERSWYDEHREAILAGWTGDGGDAGGKISRHIVDVSPFMHAGCYDGFGDDETSFYSVYGTIFRAVDDGERDGRAAEGGGFDPDRVRRPDFGDASSEWVHTNAFFGVWESFASGLSFAHADKYDTREAPDRRVRRAMEEENKKLRKGARRERAEDLAALVAFVKRRDPRVGARREKVEKDRAAAESKKLKAAAAKKAGATAARAAWREEMAAHAEAEEFETRKKFRLADEGSSDDGGRKKNRGKKGRKKKGKKGRRRAFSSSDEDGEGETPSSGRDGDRAGADNVMDNATTRAASASGGGDRDAVGERVDTQPNTVVSGNSSPLDDPTASEKTGPDVIEPQCGADGGGPVLEPDESDTEQESESEEEEPDSWYCPACKKDFKSKGQMENHKRSKKCKKAWKKYEERLQTELEEELDAVILEDILDRAAAGGETVSVIPDPEEIGEDMD